MTPHQESSAPAVESILTRPIEQRLREHKYRCAQAIVFGLPVLALHYFGARLGGPEAARWSAILQALLAGWVMFVAATGMIFEGAIVLIARRRVTGDFVVAVTALLLYLYSALAIFTQRTVLFHVCVIVLAGWSALRWRQLCGSSTRHATL